MFLSVACKGAIDLTGGLWYCGTVNRLAFSKYLLQKIDPSFKHLPKIRQKTGVNFNLFHHRTALKYTVEA